MKSLKTFIPLAATLFVLQAPTAGAQVVAHYNFDGREADGGVSLRLNSQDDPFPGEDYVPDPQKGESGPPLVNIGGGGQAAYYRSYYNHGGTEGADGREVLELRTMHGHYLDFYQTPEGEGPLPAEGSFTWELVVRIDGFTGANGVGILVDASKGIGRLAGYPMENAETATTTRLSLAPIENDETQFRLDFNVPTDDQNKVVRISAELEFGKWYHLVAVYDEDSQQTRIYVNGDEAAWGDVLSTNARATGFAIGGYGPEVKRVDNGARLNAAFFDAVAFSKGALGPDQWVLKPKQK